MELEGRVELNKSNVVIEFGKWQCNLGFSRTGKLARTLKLKEGDIVTVQIDKLFV